MLYQFNILKDDQPTKHTVFASNATSEDDAKFRIRKAGLIGEGETLGTMIQDDEDTLPKRAREYDPNHPEFVG